jgi:glycosyltransferase involved in cell wall biosynthesis
MHTPAGDRRLRVVFDMTFADKSLTGTRVYAHQLKAAIEATGRLDILTVAAPTQTRRPGQGNLLSGAQNLIWLQLKLPAQLAALQAGMLHESAFLGTLRAPCPMVVNVLDTIYLSYPDDFNYKWRLYARLGIGPTVRRAAAVITLSEFSRSAVVAAYHIPRERIHVVYPGVGAQFQPAHDPAAIAAVRVKYGLSDDYILFVGAADKRKNLATLIQAFARLKSGGRFPTLLLVLVGPGGRGAAGVAEAIKRTRMEHSVIQPGYVADQDLPLLYAGARFLVFPSLMEGFGMPLIEAMACGTAVVAVPCPPIPEVVGGAALLAQDASADALATAMERVLCDEELAQHLHAQGLERARQFTWERAANQTMEVYEQVSKERKTK